MGVFDSIFGQLSYLDGKVVSIDLLRVTFLNGVLFYALIFFGKVSYFFGNIILS